VTVQDGKALTYLIDEMNETIKEASTYEELKPYLKTFQNKLSLNEEIIGFLQPFANKGNFERYLADATLYMEFFGTLLVAWQWLKMATQAKKAMVVGDTQRDTDFYESKIQSMKFFFKYELPKVESLKESITNRDMITIVEEKELII